MKANEALTLRMIRAVEERDAARLLELYHPDVEFVWPSCLPGYGGTHRGMAAVEMGNAFAAQWDPVQPTDAERRLSAEIVASSDDEVVVRYHQQGVDDQGRQLHAEVLAVYRFAEGKVTRLQMFYFDPQPVADFLREAAGADTALP